MQMSCAFRSSRLSDDGEWVAARPYICVGYRLAYVNGEGDFQLDRILIRGIGLN